MPATAMWRSGVAIAAAASRLVLARSLLVRPRYGGVIPRSRTTNWSSQGDGVPGSARQLIARRPRLLWTLGLLLAIVSVVMGLSAHHLAPVHAVGDAPTTRIVGASGTYDASTNYRAAWVALLAFHSMTREVASSLPRESRPLSPGWLPQRKQLPAVRRCSVLSDRRKRRTSPIPALTALRGIPCAVGSTSTPRRNRLSLSSTAAGRCT